MSTFSARTLTYFRICFLLTIAFYFLKDPGYLLEIPFVILLAKSMELPFVDIDQYNAVFGVLAYVFGLLALGDLVPLLEGNTAYFEGIVPVRLLTYFAIATYSCVGSHYFICNNMVFLYSFFEIFFHVLIFTSLKEEQYQKQKALQGEVEDPDEDIKEYLYGEGGEDENDPEYERVLSDIRERVSYL